MIKRSFIEIKIKGNNLFFLKTNILFLSLIVILLAKNITNHSSRILSRFITINKRRIVDCYLFF